VADFKEPPIIVPLGIYTLLGDVISLRKMVSEMIYWGAVGTSNRADDDGHIYFINVLKRVQEVLKPRVEKAPLFTKQTASDQDLGNVFAALDLDEPEPATATSAKPSQ
jgi:hypothetical protein